MSAKKQPEGVTLKVARAHHQSEVGLGRARVDTQTRKALNVDVGEIIEIVGKKRTAAKVFRAAHEDEGQSVIRIDGMIRGNAGVSIGEKVVVSKAGRRRRRRSWSRRRSPRARGSDSGKASRVCSRRDSSTGRS
jgi:transitional endoplasmic reticulum ATPase